MAETLLSLRDIRVHFGTNVVLDVPSLDVFNGEVLGVLGPNGAGKTTLLRVMGLLLRPTSGKICFLGKEAARSNNLIFRRCMASVFKEPLLLNATVYENVALGLKLRGLRTSEVRAHVEPWLERFGIAHLSQRRGRSVSGGEAQRASLARAFVLEPKLLLLDEPFSSLDQPTREGLMIDLQRIFQDTGVTTVFVTHERQEAMALSHRIAILSRSRVVQLGDSTEVCNRPLNEEAATIVGRRNARAVIS